MEKRVGSQFLVLVFVRQRLDVRFGSPAPSLNEKNGLWAGPDCQVEWDTIEGPFLSFSLRELQSLEASIQYDFYWFRNEFEYFLFWMSEKRFSWSTFTPLSSYYA